MNESHDAKSLLFTAVAGGALTLLACFLLEATLDSGQRAAATRSLPALDAAEVTAALEILSEPPNSGFRVPGFPDPLQALLGVGLVALAILIARDLRLGAAIPPAFVEEFTEQVNRRRYKEAFLLCRDHTSFLAGVLLAGMGRLQYGLDEARKSAADALECGRATKKQAINQLLALAILAPTLGLASGGLNLVADLRQLPAAPLTGAQWADLLTAAGMPVVAGLFLLAAGLAGHALLSDRLTCVTLDTARIADDLLTQLHHNARRPGGSDPPYWKGWKPSTL
jgi:hypothetical protein